MKKITQLQLQRLLEEKKVEARSMKNDFRELGDKDSMNEFFGKEAAYKEILDMLRDSELVK